LVREIRDKDGNIIKEIEPEVIHQVISKETTKTLLGILETVVSEGTGSNAYVEGYRVGGKTGTAQKILPGGGYSTSEYIASFMGVAPVNDPRIVALVVVDSPQGGYYGGQVAAPAFKNIVRDTLRYLQVPVQVAPEKITGNSSTVVLPNLVGMELKAAVERLGKLKLKVDIIGDGTSVKGHLPLAGNELQEGGKVILYTSIPSSGNNPETVVVPDLTGKTITEVNEITKLLNLNFEIQGSGIVIKQEPEPGIQIPVGSKLMIIMEPKAANTLVPYGP
jgi:stage V sporulation protein D (sporulation-specific penicillin-binding protein)